MKPYDWAMEEVSLAIIRLADALLANNRSEIDRECEEGQRIYTESVRLYPRLQLRPQERDSFLHQMSLLGSQLNECKRIRARARRIMASRAG